ncbi:MAG: LacI family DNA-binding transcriptional regulator [Humibacillus sp.]|nr:LacI family DNA-binding transcriptional regulator [Humibacillus sp.]MDN5776402.1 LacI family DNA-binding transcriptional regulator [Humibacillus sp.]
MTRRAERPHRVLDIAEQSGLSEATVDRVLHDRAGASPRARRAVEQAMTDLDRQQSQLRHGTQTLLVDVVSQAPARFSTAVRVALEAELSSVRPAVARARFHLRESADVAAVVEVLDGLGRRGRVPRGVLLKAPDDPLVAQAIRRLSHRGVPVVTLVTDIRDSSRVAYVGLDNAAAGRAAAYLASRCLGGHDGDLLVALSRGAFFGESERAAACVETFARLEPQRSTCLVNDGDGLDETTRRVVVDALERHRSIIGVYSIGGGNRSIAQAFADVGRPCQVFLAHDLDDENLQLLRSGALTAVLHHDLQADMRHALRQLMRAHRMLPGAPISKRANVEVITPFNEPIRLTPL